MYYKVSMKIQNDNFLNVQTGMSTSYYNASSSTLLHMKVKIHLLWSIAYISKSIPRNCYCFYKKKITVDGWKKMKNTDLTKRWNLLLFFGKQNIYPTYQWQWSILKQICGITCCHQFTDLRSTIWWLLRCV